MEQTAENLISKIVDGDKQALAELYAQTRNAVYGFALSIVRNKHDAEDIMQETYVRIYMAAPEYRAQGKPMAWVLMVTRNLALMKLRAGKKSTAPLDEAWDPPDTRDGVGQSLDKLVLGAAMTQLASEERQIVILHAVAGLKHREIAELMQIPLSTTLSKYNRALSKLKKCLKEDEQHERKANTRSSFQSR